MKQGQGKNKGSNFERLLCRKLTKWITGKERPEIFWRTASSGGKATQDQKTGVDCTMDGDIMAISNRGQWFTDYFFVECKFYKDFDLLNMLKEKGLIFRWWEKLENSAWKTGKEPILILKKNRYSPLIMFRWESHIMTDRFLAYGNRLIYKNIKKERLVLVYLFDFLEYNNCDELKYEIGTRIDLSRKLTELPLVMDV